MNGIQSLASRMLLRRALVSIALILPFSALSAEGITMDEAVAMALQSNLGIESELLSVRQKKLIADTWWNQFYPTASASITTGRPNDEPAASTFNPDPTTWSLSASVGLNLTLTLQTIPGIALARLDHENSLITLEKARAEVEVEVRKQFLALLLLQEQIALQEGNIASAERRYQQAQANYNNGLVDEYTLLASRVTVENQRPVLSDLQVAYQQALFGFKNSIGLPLTAEVTPVGEISAPTIKELPLAIDRERLRNRFDLQQVHKAEEILNAQKRNTTLLEMAPSIRLGWSYSPSFAGEAFGDNWFDNDMWSDTDGFRSRSRNRSMPFFPTAKRATAYPIRNVKSSKMRSPWNGRIAGRRYRFVTCCSKFVPAKNRWKRCVKTSPWHNAPTNWRKSATTMGCATSLRFKTPNRSSVARSSICCKSKKTSWIA